MLSQTDDSDTDELQARDFYVLFLAPSDTSGDSDGTLRGYHGNYVRPDLGTARDGGARTTAVRDSEESARAAAGEGANDNDNAFGPPLSERSFDDDETDLDEAIQGQCASARGAGARGLRRRQLTDSQNE